jgi:hypothetical protein
MQAITERPETAKWTVALVEGVGVFWAEFEA